MTTIGLSGLDHSIEITRTWIKDLLSELEWTDDQKAYRVLRTVLHTLRDRMPLNEAVHLGAQLPMLVRGFYYENWRPSSTPTKARTIEAFLEPIRNEFRVDEEVDAEQVTRGVFVVLTKHITGGEIEDVQKVLPEALRDLWPSQVA